jgi:hypothetical protein
LAFQSGTRGYGWSEPQAGSFDKPRLEVSRDDSITMTYTPPGKGSTLKQVTVSRAATTNSPSSPREVGDGAESIRVFALEKAEGVGLGNALAGGHFVVAVAEFTALNEEMHRSPIKAAIAGQGKCRNRVGCQAHLVGTGLQSGVRSEGEPQPFQGLCNWLRQETVETVSPSGLTAHPAEAGC